MKLVALNENLSAVMEGMYKYVYRSSACKLNLDAIRYWVIGYQCSRSERGFYNFIAAFGRIIVSFTLHIKEK
jgi:hypothetical protein